jgi:hypothetical protein
MTLGATAVSEELNVVTTAKQNQGQSSDPRARRENAESACGSQEDVHVYCQSPHDE